MESTFLGWPHKYVGASPRFGAASHRLRAPMPRDRGLHRYVVALLGVLVAVGFKIVLRPITHEDEAAMGFFAAIMFAAWYGGLAPGLFATVVSAFVSDYLFLSPLYTFNLRSWTDWMRLSQFLAEGALISAMGGSLHRAQARAEAQKERAEAANCAKDNVLACVSHELRTPLGGVLLWSKLLKAGNLSEAEKQAVEKIIRCAEDQIQLVEDLLDTSRIVTGKMRVEMREIDLAKVVRTAIDNARLNARAKNIGLDLSAVPQAMVFGDAARLGQVVSNLLTNALKFTPAGGRVEVGLACQGDKARLAVTDDGEGISPEYLPRVFVRFSQADHMLTGKHGGLGLGLSIAKEIVELHGGTISARSDGKGRGSSFAVEIPLLTDPSSPQQPARAAACPTVPGD
ncbi:MAG: signal transduction histidine kinase [Phycisphaerales bacterium]|nr:signal transduction histidine kinase [Phycisphaerales bacterium]